MTGLLEELLLNPDQLAIAAFGATLLFAAVAAWALAPTLDGQQRRLQRRLTRITRQRRPVAADPEEEAQARMESVRRQGADQRFVALNRSLRHMLPNTNRLRLRMERAGWRISLGEYLIGGLVLGLITAALSVLLYGMPPILGALAAVSVGVGVPHMVLNNAVKRRMRRFMLQLPDAIDLIVRGVKSGLPVSEAINVIGSEMEDPIASEFRHIGAQLSIGVDLNEALWTVARRLDLQEFKFFAISLAIQRETGGNLAEVLENLSSLIRKREQVRLKIKAMSSEARASGMIIGSLPFIMAILIYMVNPEYMSKLVTDPRGWLLIGIGLTMMSLGVLVMARMIRFEI
jgi:tight adherence protein B